MSAGVSRPRTPALIDEERPYFVPGGVWRFHRKSVGGEPCWTRTCDPLLKGSSAFVDSIDFQGFRPGDGGFAFASTLAGIHIEHDTVGAVRHLRLCEHNTVHGSRPWRFRASWTTCASSYRWASVRICANPL